LFGECVCIHCFDCSLVSSFTNGVIEKFITIFVYHSKKSKSKPFSAFCTHLWEFLKPILHKTCDCLA
jgi:hypothetical protein